MRILLLILCASVVLHCEPTKSSLNIGIQPYQGMDASLTDTIKNTLEEVYGAKVYVYPPVAMPQEAFVNIKSPRYRADILIKMLKENKPDSIRYVLGLTSKDISCTKTDASGKIKEPEYKYKDWGIFGLGYMPGPSCIVSTYRLKHENKQVFITRLKKVCVHELGHNFGLEHCTTPRCVMQDAAETIKTIDNVDLELCDKCKVKVEHTWFSY